MLSDSGYSSEDIARIVKSGRTLPGLTERETRVVWVHEIGLPATATDIEIRDLQRTRGVYEQSLKKLEAAMV